MADPAISNNWSANSWALVVGIDVYDIAEVPKLTGAVADAVAAVTWLRTFGVPDAQILVNATPSQTSKVSLDQLGIQAQNASFGNIWASINKLRHVTDGARLFIFLSGHGLYDAEDGRLFLTQDYAVNGDLSNNLGLDSFQDFFRSLTFREQFFFFDGCQNYPVSPSIRSAVKARKPPPADYTPRPENGMVACYAASQDQFALEIAGRGAMLQPLLDGLAWARLCALPSYDPRQTAITYDWQTGRRTLDLRRLYLQFIKPDVTAAAANEGRLQTPVLEVYGAAAGWTDLPIIELPMESTAELRVAVEPPQATEAVAQIYISLKSPRRDYYLPQRPPLVLPDICRVPRNAEIEPLCHLNSITPWLIKSLPRPFTATRPQHDAVFQFERGPGGRPSPTAGQAEKDADLFNVRLIAADGQQTSVSFDAYNTIVEQTGLAMPMGQTGSDGVLMQPHEYGPDFAAAEDAPNGSRDLIEGWARAFARVRPGRVDHVAIVPPGKLLEGHRPNLAFRMPKGPETLGGFLTEQRVVFIERPSESWDGRYWRGNGDYSLGALEDLKQIWVEPGYHRIRIELPWGSWTDLIDVPHTGIAECRLPESIGLPPLRNSIPRGLAATLMIADAEPGMVSDSSGHGYFTRWRPVLNTAPFTTGRALSLEFEYLEPHTRFATLAWPFDRMLAFDPAALFPRAEPYSTTPLAEWDLLVSCGRLDAIAPERLSELCHGGWASKGNRDDLLGVALAYAAHDAKALEDLEAILVELNDRADLIIDIALLQGTLPGPSLAGRDDVRRRLESGELPVFRWGLRLARDIAGGNLLIDRIQAVTPAWSNWLTAFGPFPAQAAAGIRLKADAEPAAAAAEVPKQGSAFEA